MAKKKTTKEKPITAQERVFVLEYLKDRNAEQAAVRAKYSANGAPARGWLLLQRPRVKAFLDQELAKLEADIGFTARDVLRKLWGIADLDLSRLLNEDGSVKPVSAWPEGYGKVIAGLKIDELFEGAGRDKEQVGWTKEVKLEGRTAAAVALGKYFKLFTEKVEQTGKDGGPVIVRWEGEGDSK